MSPVERKKSSTRSSNESFYPPYQFLNSPADAGFETLTSVVNVDETQFLSQRGGSMGMGTLQEKVQGIPPAFLKPLIKKRLFENDTLRFYAEVFGLPSPEVRWFFRKKLLVADDRVTMERDGDNISLTIHSVTKADQGEYICEAVNYVGEARSVALVGVLSQEVKLIPAPPAVTHQHVMEFDVEEHDSRSPSPQEILLEVELDENEEGTVDFVTQEHDDLKIVTETPPKCIVPLMNVTTAVGTPVILQCLVKGKPNPTAAWYKDGDPVTDSRCIIQEKTAGHFNLLITNVTHSDAGEYKCIIKNSAGCTETTALLKCQFGVCIFFLVYKFAMEISVS
uniref:Ig-like domain-containing protein n=1 Tax=Oryzias melastigma TaxID=30732 RepID=A0A3B3BY31_ORYME